VRSLTIGMAAVQLSSLELTFSVTYRDTNKTERFRVSRSLPFSSLESLIKRSFQITTSSIGLRDSEGYVLPIDPVSLPSEELFLDVWNFPTENKEKTLETKEKRTEEKKNKKAREPSDESVESDFEIESFIITCSKEETKKEVDTSDSRPEIIEPRKSKKSKGGKRSSKEGKNGEGQNFVCPVCEKPTTKIINVTHDYQVEYYNNTIKLGDRFCKSCYQTSYGRMIKKQKKRPVNEVEEKEGTEAHIEDTKKIARPKRTVISPKKIETTCMVCAEVADPPVTIKHQYQLDFFGTLNMQDKVCKKCWKSCYNFTTRQNKKAKVDNTEPISGSTNDMEQQLQTPESISLM